MEETGYISTTKTDLQERELLVQLIHGEIAGYEILFHKYYAPFYAFIKGMTKDQYIAEDITQNIFLKVWLNREKLDETKSIRNYLFVLAKHEVYNYFRSKDHSVLSLRDVIIDASTGGGMPTSRSNETEEQIELRETIHLVESVVQKMPPQRQHIFRLSRFEHLPSKEIATRLNLSVRTVDKHLELALRELRNHMDLVPIFLIFLHPGL